MRTLAAILFCFCLLLAAPLSAQKGKREPLTEAQADQIAEADIDPVARVDLYVKFLNERSDTIKDLIKRAKSPARARRIDDELQDFSSLMDELGDNLDVFSERKADIRKSLKPLNDGIQRWQGVLHDLPSEPGFELSLKEALDSVGDLAGQTKQITADQEAYFKAHRDEKGQDRAEPK
jgi:predicted  nucleic acid-binding Zn-ribbon protein